MKRRKYTDEQIRILEQYYPTGEWDKILPHFPNQSKVNIRATAKRCGLRMDEKETLSKADLTGQRFGQLTCLHIDTKPHRGVYWVCKCDCGKETSVSLYNLTKGITKSCGCLRNQTAHNALDLTGQKFGMLTAIERLPKYRGKVAYWRCICDCGATNVIVSTGNLRSGHTVSCGNHNHKRQEYWFIRHPDEDTDERTYTVYRHISPSGKSYIGITKQIAEKRFQEGSGYKTQPVFWRAIKKYGWETFKHEILEEGLNVIEASEREAYYIENVYHSYTPNGYNVAEGGTTGRKMVKPVIQYYNGNPVNFFKSLKDAKTLLNIAETTIHAHSQPDSALCGYYFEFLPRMHNYEIPTHLLHLIDESHYNLKALFAEHHSATTIARNLSMSKRINKYALDGRYICTFASIAEARASIENSDGGGICAAVNPNRQGDTAYGYMWKYDTGGHSNIPPFKHKKRYAVLQLDPDTEEIICEYPTMTAAARAFNTTATYIGEACRGKRDTWRGFMWRIKD